MTRTCECGATIKHDEDHPGQCCACFDIEAGLPVAQALREEREAARREGVIEGLERALVHAQDIRLSHKGLLTSIRFEIERLREEKP